MLALPLVALTLGGQLCFSPPAVGAKTGSGTSSSSARDQRPETSSTPRAQRAEGPELPGRPEPYEPVAKENWRMVVAGDVLVGISMASFGVMVAGLAVRARGIEEVDRLALRDDPSEGDRRSAEERVELGNQLAIGGGVATAVLLGSGITMIAVGHRREKRRRAAAASRVAGAGVWANGRGAGAQLNLRF